MQKTEEILRYILHIFHNFANKLFWFVTIGATVTPLPIVNGAPKRKVRGQHDPF